MVGCLAGTLLLTLLGGVEWALRANIPGYTGLAGEILARELEQDDGTVAFQATMAELLYDLTLLNVQLELQKDADQVTGPLLDGFEEAWALAVEARGGGQQEGPVAALPLAYRLTLTRGEEVARATVTLLQPEQDADAAPTADAPEVALRLSLEAHRDRDVLLELARRKSVELSAAFAARQPPFDGLSDMLSPGSEQDAALAAGHSQEALEAILLSRGRATALPRVPAAPPDWAVETAREEGVTVSTPAGEFPCVRVEVRGARQLVLGDETPTLDRLRVEVWCDPALGAPYRVLLQDEVGFRLELLRLPDPEPEADDDADSD